MPDTHLPFSAAAERNQGPILDVLRRLLPTDATVLEIASGTGQHAAHFASQRPAWQWQPTDADPTALPTIAARCQGLSNVRKPVLLDVLTPWPETLGRFDAVYCANMLHISPWSTCAALMRGAAARLGVGGALVIYGPFLVEGQPTAPSNLAFDADLRARDPRWGLRRLNDVAQEALAEGLEIEAQFDMPANNLVVVLRRG